MTARVVRCLYTGEEKERERLHLQYCIAYITSHQRSFQSLSAAVLGQTGHTLHALKQCVHLPLLRNARVTVIQKVFSISIKI